MESPEEETIFTLLGSVPAVHFLNATTHSRGQIQEVGADSTDEDEIK